MIPNHLKKIVRCIPPGLFVITTLICAHTNASHEEGTTFPYSFDLSPREFSQILNQKRYDRLSVPLQREPVLAFFYAGPYETLLPQKQKHFKPNPLNGDTPAKAQYKFLKNHHVNVDLKKDTVVYQHTVLGVKRPSQAASQTGMYYSPELLTLLSTSSGGMKTVETYLNYIALFALAKQGVPSALTPDMVAAKMPEKLSDFISLLELNQNDLAALAQFAQAHEELWFSSLFYRAYGAEADTMKTLAEEVETEANATNQEAA